MKVKYLLMISILFITGCSTNEEPNTVEVSFDVTAGGIINEYNIDELNSTVKYDDEYGYITGTISELDLDNEIMYVYLQTQIVCPVHDLDSVIDLNVRDKITIYGYVNSWEEVNSAYNLNIEDCQIED